MFATSDSMLPVLEQISDYCSRNPSKKCIFFLDIDNTFLKMSGALGSDQWFKWQHGLIIDGCDDRVADTFEELCSILYKIYELVPCEPCEEGVPTLLKQMLISHKNMVLVFITARSPAARKITVQQINHIMDSKVPVPCELIMCDGKRKAPFVLQRLQKQKERVERAFMVDDSVEHLIGCAKIPDLMGSYSLDLIHYTHQGPAVADFNSGDKKNVIDALKRHSLSASVL